jgi:hypothetical protein
MIADSKANVDDSVEGKRADPSSLTSVADTGSWKSLLHGNGE